MVCSIGCSGGGGGGQYNRWKPEEKEAQGSDRTQMKTDRHKNHFHCNSALA